MTDKKLLIALSLVVAAIIIYVALVQTTPRPPTVTVTTPRPPTVTVTQIPSDQVPLYFSSGKIDMYLHPRILPTDVIAQLQGNPNLTLVSPGMRNGYSLVFNPYPSNKTFNPFAYRQFRFLMNYLVDRSGYVAQIFRGFASPMLAWPGPFALNSYVLIVPYISQFNIRYDPTYVKTAVTALFSEINKTDPVWRGRILWMNDKWYYIPPDSTTPQPVTIIFFNSS